MATTVDRGMGMAAGALLPGLLPTPPRSTMLAPCTTITLPADFPKPGRADSVKRWDAHKNGEIETSSPTSSHSSNTMSSASSNSSGRADSADRWDTHKNGKTDSCSPASSHGSSTALASSQGSNTLSSSSSASSSNSPGRADSADRWDVHKKKKLCIWSPGSKIGYSSPISSSKINPDSADSCERWGMNKERASSSGSSSSPSIPRWVPPSRNKRPPSRASSADRWDAHKKIRSTEELDDAESGTDEQETNKPQDDETSTMVKTAGGTMDCPVFSGPCFSVSPDPSLLPMPAFMLPLPTFLLSH